MAADEKACPPVKASPPATRENTTVVDPDHWQTSFPEEKELCYITQGFRDELLGVLKTEMQAMGGKICRDSCREIRRFMDSTAKSRRLERRNEEGKDLVLGFPADGANYTGFMQRHRLQNASDFTGQWKSNGDQEETYENQNKPMILSCGIMKACSASKRAARFPEPPLPGAPDISPPDQAPPQEHVAARLSYESFMSQGFGSGPDNNAQGDDISPTDFAMDKCEGRRGAIKFTSSRLDDDDHGFGSRPRWNDPRYVKKAFAAFIKGDLFDYIMGSILALNAIFMGAQVEVLADGNPNPNTLHVFDNIDWVFACLFLTEVVLRIAVNGKQFFCDKFSVADIFIVTLHFTELIVKQAAAGSEGMIDQLGMLRMLRLGRLARMVRMVRLIPELKSMVYLMSASMGSFVWAVVLMIVVMYAFAIYFTEICIDIRKDRPNDALDIGSKWGSIWKSMLTLYMAISGGEDWNVLLLPLTYTQAEFALLNQTVFSAYVAFSTLVMLNLVTGVFVEGAQRIIKEEQDNEVLRIASKAFVKADADLSCEISWNEFQGILKSEQMSDYCDAVGISLGEACDLFDILDIDKSESLSVDEFVKGCLKLRGSCTRMDMAQVRHKSEKGMMELKAEIEGVTGLLQKCFKQVDRGMTGKGIGEPPWLFRPDHVAEEV